MKLEELQTLQEKIKKNDKKHGVCMIISIVLSLSFIIIYFQNCANTFSRPSVILIFLMLSPMIICMASGPLISSEEKRVLREEYKSAYVLKYLKEYFDELVFTPEKGFTEDEIIRTEMLYTGESFRSNDYISGKYKNIDFEESDIWILIEHTDSDGDTSWETKFGGPLMIFDFNKPFKSNRVLVFSSDFYCSPRINKEKYTQVEMDDEVFNNLYKVYSETEHDSYYLLTPHFMEKLKKVHEELKCDILFGFAGSKLFVALDNRRDLFEPSMNNKLTEEEIENRITKDIKVMTYFVDELNLEDDLFKKEA